jgi:hypothetical protein
VNLEKKLFVGALGYGGAEVSLAVSVKSEAKPD